MRAICGAVDVSFTLYCELIDTVVATRAFSPVLAELASVNQISQSWIWTSAPGGIDRLAHTSVVSNGPIGGITTLKSLSLGFVVSNLS